MHVNPDNSKRPGDTVYNSVINEIQGHGVCPFCPEHLLKYHKNPILENGAYWLATDNMYPYSGTKHHVLFIHKEHIQNVSEISEPAWKEFREILTKMIDMKKIPGGTFFIRFGDTKYTGASVTHLHAHLVSSDPSNESYKPLLARVG